MTSIEETKSEYVDQFVEKPAAALIADLNSDDWTLAKEEEGWRVETKPLEDDKIIR